MWRRLQPPQILIRWTPHPVIVTLRDNRDHIRVLLYSYYTTITGWGVHLRSYAGAVEFSRFCGAVDGWGCRLRCFFTDTNKNNNANNDNNSKNSNNNNNNKYKFNYYYTDDVYYYNFQL